MTFANGNVNATLRKNFVCGWRNIQGEERYAGSSNVHQPGYAAKTVTNCSGHHNVQMFFMTHDGKVLNCLPGFWNVDAFLDNVRLAAKLNKIYHKKNISRVEKNDLFLDMHLNHALKSYDKMKEESELQGFDKKKIMKKDNSDFKRQEGFITGELKAADQVLHERMAERPFVPIESFQVSSFIDMGTKKYSYKYGMPGEENKKMRKRKR